MYVTIRRIAAVEEFDFDGLFDASFPDMDNNFFFKTDPGVSEDKRNAYKDQLLAYMRTDPNFFGYVIAVDEVDCVLNAGVLDGSTYLTSWYLTKKINNSRSYIYSQEVSDQRSMFFADVGITQYKVKTFTGSILYSALRRNHTNGIINILDEAAFTNDVVANGVEFTIAA